MPRVVCVSNRVSLPDPETGRIKAGGLAVGVRAALESCGGGIWFGWNGAKAATAAERDSRPPERQEANGITFLTIPLTQREYDEFYKKMANEALWPLMHELGDHIDETGSAFQTYREVNAMFARQVRMILEPGDVVWVHDYHLIPMGQELRKLGVENRILFFNHIPIPSAAFMHGEQVPDSLKAVYRHLVGSLFSYDQVGFQSFRDLHNFMDYLGLRTPEAQRFKAGSQGFGPRGTRFGVFPISIETRSLEKKARKNSDNPDTRDIQDQSGNCHIIMGAERLDYTKGLTYRIRGVSRLLSSHPEYNHHIKYVQVTPLSRDDIQRYKRTVERTREAIETIQSRFSDEEWNPVMYSEQMMERDHLIGCFRHARVGLVTPLMDGQNLVAKEFIAAQDPDDPGLLVLSRYAGAAEELGEHGALLVDPRDPDDIAAKIDAALKTPYDERLEIHRDVIAYLRAHDINHWARSFLEN